MNIIDPLFTLAFLFQGGRDPPAPFGACGEDPTTDGLDCAAYVPADENLRCGGSISVGFTVSPSKGPAPLLVRLNALDSSSPSGPILEYAWSLGDGAEATGPVVNHTFEDAGSYEVELTVTDREDATASATRLVEVEGISATTIVATSPTTGETGVALTRETVIEFRRSVVSKSWPDAIVTTFGGEIISGRYHLSPDGRRVSLFYRTASGDPRTLPASARVRVTVDGDSILDDLGRAVDADGDGEAGGTRAIDFDTIALVSIPGTSVTGTVMASERAVTPGGASVDVPLPGVAIRVDGAENELSAVTDRDGRFLLEDAPAGTFFVHVDGRTATADVPSGTFYPVVGKSWASVAGRQVDVGTIYLPLIASGTLRPVSHTVPTTISFPPAVLARYPDLAGVSVTVPADSLFSDDGTRGGAVGIGPVAPDRLPAALPPELRFPLVITVQTSRGGPIGSVRRQPHRRGRRRRGAGAHRRQRSSRRADHPLSASRRQRRARRRARRPGVRRQPGRAQPPEVTTETPAAGKTTVSGAKDLFVSWSEPIAESSLGLEDVALVGAGPDRVFASPDDEIIEAESIAYRPALRLLRVSFGEPFPPDLYRAVIGPAVTDLAGHPLAEPHAWTFEITEMPDLARQESFQIEGTTTGGEVLYPFLAPAGQLVFFDERNDVCNERGVRWSRTGEDGAFVFRDQPLEDCGPTDAGRFVLEQGGRYDLRITGAGSYAFAVWNVIVSEFDIEIGDTVDEDQPDPGAGRLSVPGEIDVYTFTAAPGTGIYLDELYPPCEVDIIWQLDDEDGALFFDGNEELSACGIIDQGTARLERGGLYRLTVEARQDGRGAFRGDDDGLGTYAFRVWGIEPGEFTIAVGDTVTEGVPGPGAGTFETPGNYDLYHFEAAAGTIIHFDELAPSCGNGFLWDLFDEDGTALFEGDDLQTCDNDPENVLVLEGGTYTMRVRAKFDQATTGPYSFALVRESREGLR